MQTVSRVSVLSLYQAAVATEQFQALAKRYLRKAWFFTLSVTCWLMIRQRLEGSGTLQEALDAFVRGECDPLLTRAQRRRAAKASSSTGALSQSRSNMPVQGMRMVVKTLGESLLQQVAGEEQGDPILLLDGSSAQMPHTEELVKQYPPATNQHGASHWPVLRMVVMHDLQSGLAALPAYGPMYGPKATSEQQLAEELLDQVRVGTTIIADRNFGIFAIAYACAKRKLNPIVRLTASRAKVINGGPLKPGLVRDVVWRPSRYDRQAHPDLPPDAEVRGRLIVQLVAGYRDLLYLFTTAEGDVDQIIARYGKRWNIETDLRSIKTVLKMARLTSQSKAMVEKEMLAAIAAYNLVRAVMVIAAKEAGLGPRSLSFCGVLSLVKAFWQDLMSPLGDRHAHKQVARMIHYAGQRKLPKRKQARSFPRQIWRPGYRFPFRTAVPAQKAQTEHKPA